MGETIHWEGWELDAEDYLLSREDGLPARHQGPWAKKKLDFLSEYLEFAIQATKKARGSVYYLDLFAGPGRNAWGAISREFQGSPLRAMEASHSFPEDDQPTGFDHLYFCNLNDVDHEVLRRRATAKQRELDDEMELGAIYLRHGDSNELIHDILADIPTYAIIIAFADIQGPANLRFETVEALRSQHGKVDFYVHYPSGVLDRILPYDEGTREQYRDTLNAFFGTKDWEPIVERRQSTGQATKMRRELLELYIDRLEALWDHVGVKPEKVKGPRGYYYHMIFATNKDFAEDAADSVAKGDQGSFLDDLGLD